MTHSQDDTSTKTEPRSRSDRGPLIQWRVEWVTGLIDVIEAHQVTMPLTFSDDGFIQFHGEIDGRWGLVLAVVPSRVKAISRVGKS